MYSFDFRGAAYFLMFLALIGVVTGLWNLGSWIVEPKYIELDTTEWSCSEVIPAQQLGEVPTCAEYRRHELKKVAQ